MTKPKLQCNQNCAGCSYFQPDAQGDYWCQLPWHPLAKLNLPCENCLFFPGENNTCFRTGKKVLYTSWCEANAFYPK